LNFDPYIDLDKLMILILIVWVRIFGLILKYYLLENLISKSLEILLRRNGIKFGIVS